ncbi:gfo/Idh/MocA family oxidoreductase [Euzebyella marina]|uniref:Gfo/Idh/MocA family oxidoreductase n=1 Tax=Euzebyella marina TaxID=1761453 RepID=A0A3G2L255_9FLAO|nr:Gfo/Idh/MocA family oxidoreductase [Euzebyella marina]AYN66322.1 gfo/Idh/MocA family oxidoreductase [Euzebyella marina]
MATLGIGMVGARYGARMHYENYSKLAHGLVEIRGVCALTKESAQNYAAAYQVPMATDSLEELLANPAIDIIDICTPPASHHEIAIKAANAGKHIIMEKPLTGYFGEPDDEQPIGKHVSRDKMRRGASKNAEAVREAVTSNRVKFCYAENWVYSPPILKMQKLIRASKGSILELRAEENHSGSNSFFSKEWRFMGGGSLLRMGAHSVGACIYLKQFEGYERLGRPIRPISVIADTADLMHSDASNRAKVVNAHEWISSNPVDVENWANVVIRFEDGSRATVMVSDVGLGGLNTRVTAYMTDGVIKANMTLNDAVETYSVDPNTFANEYYTEKLETKAGWNRPSCDEDWFRGFSQEISDFIYAIKEDRQPLSGIDLAVDCVHVIYAAYQSAEEGRRIDL